MEHWFEWLLSILMTVLGIIGLRIWNKQDSLEASHNAMKVQCVTREDLRNSITELREDRKAMHAENKASLTELKDSVSKMDDTINQVALQVASLSPSRRSRQ
jgi:hypothetical protein